MVGHPAKSGRLSGFGGRYPANLARHRWRIPLEEPRRCSRRFEQMDGEYRRWGQGYIQQPRLVLFVFGALEVPHMVLDFEQLPRHGALHLGK